MVTVEADVDQVECRLAAGELSCPGCGRVLAGWGSGSAAAVARPDVDRWSCVRVGRDAPAAG